MPVVEPPKPVHEEPFKLPPPEEAPHHSHHRHAHESGHGLPNGATEALHALGGAAGAAGAAIGGVGGAVAGLVGGLDPSSFLSMMGGGEHHADTARGWEMPEIGRPIVVTPPGSGTPGMALELQILANGVVAPVPVPIPPGD